MLSLFSHYTMYFLNFKCRRKDFFTKCTIESTIGPEGVNNAIVGYDAFVISILITCVGTRVKSAFVSHSRRHLHIGSKGEGTVSRLAKVNVSLYISRIIARVVPAQVD